MKIHLENIRTLVGRHDIPIRPITILTGENSSGKSSFLACLSSILSATSFPLNPGFNTPPYSLGTYDTIASNFGKAEFFALGYEDDHGKGVVSEDARYRNISGVTKLSEYTFKYLQNEMYVQYDDINCDFKVQLKFARKPKPLKFSIEKLFATTPFGSSRFPQAVIFAGVNTNGLKMPWPDARQFLEFAHSIPDSVSIAPIRTRPERTYDLGSEDASPEGRHIPFILARLLREAESSASKKLLEALVKFGNDSGLFKGISVRSLGRKESDPFQLQANVSGRPTNLTDVGYGVSQSLPVVIESVLAASSRILLIQQPEVHLHPRAQAALGSFFVDLVNSDKKEFVIETHSDYIVDRIRQEAARGLVKPEDVVILYFERKAGKARISPISLDKNANLVGTPKGYREFFLREDMNLLTRALG